MVFRSLSINKLYANIQEFINDYRDKLNTEASRKQMEKDFSREFPGMKISVGRKTDGYTDRLIVELRIGDDKVGYVFVPTHHSDKYERVNLLNKPKKK